METAFNPATLIYQPYPDFRGNEQPPEPILFIEYGKEGNDWRPGIVQTTEAGYGFTYCHGGQVAKDDGCGHGFDEATKTLDLPVYYWADGRTQRTPIWLNPEHVEHLTIKGQKVTRRQARQFRFLREPLIYNAHSDDPTDRYTPLRDSEEMHYEWCNVCRDHFASEHECCHLRYQEGGYFLGCGSNDMDLGAAQRSLFELLEVLPPEVVHLIRDELKRDRPHFDFGRDWEDRDATIGYGAHSAEIDKDGLEAEPGAEDLYWEGMCWLSSLDHRADDAVGLTRGWLWQWEHQKWKGTCVLHEHIPLYRLSRAEFDQWYALPPNDPAALASQPLTISFRELRKQGGSLNTTNFLKDPAGAKRVWLMIREPERKEHQDHRSLTFRIASVKHDRKQAVLTLARCLDHEKHPSFLPGYKIVDEWNLRWLRRPKTKIKRRMA